MLTPEQIKRLIDDDFNSKKKRLARLGQRYYEGRHDILDYKMYYYNADGEIVEDNIRSNIKICHPFFTELVDQCVQHMLSGKEQLVSSGIVELKKELKAYFGDAFKTELSDTLTDVCCGGFGYMYAYKNVDDVTQYTYAEALGVVDVREKETDDRNKYKIYWYIDRVDEHTSQVIKRIQVWDDKFVYYYMQVNNGEVVPDDNEPINPRPHIVYELDKEEGKYGDSLGYIPFFRIDSNRKQTSHLAPVKAIIDDYDLQACGLSNNLQDVSEAIYVVKGFKGNNLDELITNARQKKAIGVGENGDVDIKTVDLPYDARVKKLEIDKEDIYHFGMGFNPTQVGDGNITNIVIQSRYALLELKCNKLQPRVKALLDELVKIALNEINEKNGTDYTIDDIEYDLTRETMTNASDNASIEKTKAETQQIKLTTILNAAAQLDDDTILEAICEVLELDYEEIKDKIPKEPQTDLNAASNALSDTTDGDDMND